MPIPRQYTTNAARHASYRARCLATAPAGIPSRAPPVAGPRGWTKRISHARELLASIAEEMTTYWDERSEAWQDAVGAIIRMSLL